ncbi:hypothetical protein GGI42DRAFT_240407 [Trichoderma sp. SZMC 28013]
MSLPKPPSSLDNSCSVIHGNTLYSYSPQGFLSLPLEDSAEWTKLDMGVKVTGGTCVGTTPVNAADAALFIVGGSSDTPDYTGLQKYTFSTGNWTTVTPSVPVTQNRLHHGSTYIPADDVILVYAGSQDGSAGPSTQTFTIQTSEPYQALSYQSNSAAPAVSPLLMSWSNADAAMISGDGVDGKIYWFNPTAGWRDSGAGTAPPINTAGGAVNVALVSGTDGSKNLYTFDLSKSPNSVSRTIVQDATGHPLANSAPIAARGLDEVSGSLEKRDLTLSNWPDYNSTLAPKDTRTNYAIAQSDDGTVVFSGGNAQVPLAIFNADKNGWVDAADLLGDDQQRIQDVSSTTTQSKTKTTSSSRSKSTTHSTSTTHSGSTTLPFSTTATATQTSDFVPTDLSIPALPTGTGSSSDDSGPSSNAILGITLGAIGGFLALLGLILLLLRCRRRQLLHPEAGKPKTPPGDEKSAPAFVAQNTFAKNTLPPHVQKQLRGHQKTASSESTSSMAILMGRVGQHKPRKLSNEFKSTISKPILQPQQAPILQIQDEKGDTLETSPTELRPQDGLADDGTRRSSGWNKYWSGGSALGILGYGSAQGQGQAPVTALAPAPANRDTLASDRSSHYSQTTTTRNVRQTQDSATVPPLNFEAPPGMSRVNTGSPVVSSYPNIPWKEGMSGTIERPVSAVSALSATSSGYSSGIPESIQETWDPTHAGKAWGADRAPSSAYAPSVSGVSRQPQLATASTSNDMSWLNLGDNSRV